MVLGGGRSVRWWRCESPARAHPLLATSLVSLVVVGNHRRYVSKPRRCSAGAHIVVAVVSGFPYRATLFRPLTIESDLKLKVWAADTSVRQLYGLGICKLGGRRRRASRAPSPRFQNFAVRPSLVGHGLHSRLWRVIRSIPLPRDRRSAGRIGQGHRGRRIQPSLVPVAPFAVRLCPGHQGPRLRQVCSDGGRSGHCTMTNHVRFFCTANQPARTSPSIVTFPCTTRSCPTPSSRLCLATPGSSTRTSRVPSPPSPICGSCSRTLV